MRNLKLGKRFVYSFSNKILYSYKYNEEKKEQRWVEDRIPKDSEE